MTVTRRLTQIWFADFSTTLYLLLLFLVPFELYLLYYLNQQFDLIGSNLTLKMILYCSLGSEGVIAMAYFKRFKESCSNYIFNNICKFLIYNQNTMRTEEILECYFDKRNNSIFLYRPEKDILEFEEKEYETLDEKQKAMLNRAKEYLTKYKKYLTKSYTNEPYYVVLTENYTVFTKELISSRSNLFLGLGLHFIFLFNDKFFERNARVGITTHVYPKKQLEEPFLVRDLAHSNIQAIKQLKNSTANEGVAVITETIGQLKRTIAETKINLDIARPRREWVVGTVKSNEFQLSGFAKNLIYLITVGIIVIVAILLLT